MVVYLPITGTAPVKWKAGGLDSCRCTKTNGFLSQEARTMAHHPHQSHRPEWSSLARTFSLHWQTSKLPQSFIWAAQAVELRNVADDGPNTSEPHHRDARPYNHMDRGAWNENQTNKGSASSHCVRSRWAVHTTASIATKCQSHWSQTYLGLSKNMGRWPDKNIKTKWTKNTLCATHTIFSIFRDGLSNRIWFVPHFLQLYVPCVIAQSPSIGTCRWQAPPLALKPPRI